MFGLCRSVKYADIVEPITCKNYQNARDSLAKFLLKPPRCDDEEDVQTLIRLTDQVIQWTPPGVSCDAFKSSRDMYKKHYERLTNLEKTAHEENTKEIVQFVAKMKDSSSEALREQARTFEGDYRRFQSGELDYAAMRGMYG